MYYDNQQIFLPYMIYDVDIEKNDYIDNDANSNDSRRDNIKLGVFGLATPETKYKSNPQFLVNTTFINPFTAAQNTINLLKTNCDIIICLCHLGIDESSEFTSKGLINNTVGLDFVLDGHSHSLINEYVKDKEGNNVLLMQCGWHGHAIGEIVLNIEQQIKSIDSNIYDESQVNEILKKECNNESDVYLLDKLNKIDENVNRLLNKTVMTNTKFLSGDRLLVRREESELGNLTATIFKKMTDSDIGIVNGGTLRTDLHKGDITKKDIITIFPFSNILQKFEIKGAIIRLMLEHSVMTAPYESFGGFLHVSGLTFSYKPSLSCDKVSNIYVNNEPLDEDKTYTVAMTDFQAVGGDDYTMFKDLVKLGDYGALEDNFIQYITQYGINEEDYKLGNIVIID